MPLGVPDKKKNKKAYVVLCKKYYSQWCAWYFKASTLIFFFCCENKIVNCSAHLLQIPAEPFRAFASALH